MTGRWPVPVPPAQHQVLVINPSSGGGKAERFGLIEQCRARGIEPVILEQGADLVELLEEAVPEGADVDGMAGGDGSQGAVASVVSRHGIAMVVVPSGTRNHLAMDLGLDRRDVVGALDAFGDARDGRTDLAEVNGRMFVDNASLGLYAEIVRSPAYREAKVETALGTLARLLGPGTRPFPLHFTGPAGERYTAAHVLQISNNPYGSPPGSIASRRLMDSGRLGVLAVEQHGGAVTGPPARCWDRSLTDCPLRRSARIPLGASLSSRRQCPAGPRRAPRRRRPRLAGSPSR
jgi:diacylglycerol kinase family enzyme